MAAFRYKAVDALGKTVRGQMVTDNEAALEQSLARIDLFLVSARAQRAGAGFGRRKVIDAREQINFYFQLEQMTRAGLPILDTLADMRDTVENPRFREVLGAVYESVLTGSTLSQAMAEHPAAFDDIPVNAVRVGEQSGRLEEVLAKVTESLKWQDELAAQAKKALMYPAFVAIVVLGTLVFMMMYVVPEMLSFLETMGQELPLETRLLIWVSAAFVAYWYLILLAPVALAVAIRTAAQRSPRVAYLLDAAKLKMWLIGPIMHKISLSRFTSYFSLMYSSGIDVLSCLGISQKVVNNRVIARALGEVASHVAEGQSIGDSVARAALFPPLVVRMIKMGEATGQLHTSLDNVSYFYDREVKEAIDKLQSMIEPAMTVVLGLLLGWMMMSVLGPVYDSMGNLGA